MKHRLTRRDAARILLVTPAAAALAPLACQTAGASGSREKLTPEQQAQKQDLAKSVSRLEASVQKLDAMEIPVGAEPAIYFAPLLAVKK
jgi:hypothetical protein